MDPETLLSQPSISLGGGKLIVDPRRQSCIALGREVFLTKTQFRILYFLAENAGRIVTYPEIFRVVEIRGKKAQQLLASHIKRIRNLLFPEDARRRHEGIETRYGLGVMLNPDVL